VAATPVRLRALAAADLEDAAGYYRAQAGQQIALEFVEAVERAFRTIGRKPHIGTPWYGFEVSIPDLRAWPVARFPYLVFYVETGSVIDVWRVLHTSRDIPVTLREVPA
jgi:toxin ParE1/3/4